MTSEPIASFIDKLLLAKKTVAGIPSWQDSTWGIGEQRLVWPLLIDGVSCNAEIEANAYPLHGNSKERWRIKILAPKCIWRIDYTNDEYHINPLDAPTGIDSVITEPHYHAWEDNSRFCLHSALPDDLPIARMMPSNVRTFPNALRWLCKKVNIDLLNTEMIDLPNRIRLL